MKGLESDIILSRQFNTGFLIVCNICLKKNCVTLVYPVYPFSIWARKAKEKSAVGTIISLSIIPFC
ncbi:MAG: hypothetical protein EWV40_05095 [Microcystis flos-aquae Mf_WU_F_19750830_S460]|uniref:Uncharacterized protein n=1 Tax=Microcystis flos-aquae Mf_WU_F_19750830_S460 TaxID=2486237 RepID=A0A552LY64_9CHRO|nr:MAG: hypothetical protein EWV40_05095 [Microcystis flos-aquae Mf_WU_F_19750830_S460]